MARSVRWDLIADPRKYQKGFREAEQTTKRFGGMVTKTAGLIGGAFAAVQIGGFLKDAINEARDAAKVGRQTAAVIKATGGAAKVSAKDVEKLATALSNKVGVDDEVIQAGENMLLTFKGVANQAGKNNDIFNQATKIAVDMTAALHQGDVTQQGLEKSTIMLGKALNDPLKGMTALQRVGVTFTDAQRKQIKTLVESGKTMEAQKVILKELGQEFGGAAEAAADPWSRLSVTFGNVKEAIGKALLPALDKAATFINDTLIPAAKKWWDEHAPKFRDAFSRANQIIGVLWAKLHDDLWPELVKGAGIIKKDLEPQLRKLDDAWKDNSDAITNLKGDLEPLNKTLFPILGRLLAGTVEEIRGVITILGWFGRAWQVAKKVAVTAFQGFYSAIISIEIGILRAMEAVVASVPGGKNSGWGKSLRAGIDKLTQFRRDFNTQMDNIKDEDVEITAKGVWVPPKGFSTALGKPTAFAAGGPISGPGTGTSDSILARLSTGEHVLSAREVRGLGGHGAVEAIRRSARGFAAGGAVNAHLNLPSAAGMAGAIGHSINRLAAAIDRLSIKIPISGANIPHQPGAWQLALSFLRSVGVPYNVISSFRPGARTHASGAQSYHALNRAVDLTGPNMMNIWRALTGTNPTELIYSRAPYYKSRRGWRPIGLLDPITRADHFSHVHAAYDKGGFLPPGLSMAYNGTGRPEPVGFDYDKLGQAIVRALQANPPVVAVDDIHRGLKAKKRGQSGIPLGLA